FEYGAPEHQRLEHQLTDVPFGQDLERALQQHADGPNAGRVAAQVQITDEVLDLEREQIADPVAAAADDAIAGGVRAAKTARFPIRDRGVPAGSAGQRRRVLEREPNQALVPPHRAWRSSRRTSPASGEALTPTLSRPTVPRQRLGLTPALSRKREREEKGNWRPLNIRIGSAHGAQSGAAAGRRSGRSAAADHRGRGHREDTDAGAPGGGADRARRRPAPDPAADVLAARG